MSRCALLAATLFALIAGPAAPAPSVLAPSLAPDDLDPPSFAQWAGGRTWPVEVREGPGAVVWTTGGGPRWDGVRYGETRAPGVRHLRIGFRRSVAVGSALVRGGGRLSVLRPGIAGAGDPADERQWAPARRLGQKADAEVGDEEYAIWVLPPGAATRALRFTHRAAPTETRYGGWLGGVCLLGDRLADVAGAARATADANGDAAGRLNDGTNNGTWNAWENGREGGAEAVSTSRPVCVTLTWTAPVALRGLCALWAGFGAAGVDAWVGPAGRDPGDARASRPGDWRPIREFVGVDSQYPRALGPNWLDFGATVRTRAIRLRITAPTGEGHPHLSGKTVGGRRVWLGELLALAPADAASGAALRAAARPAAPHPPIPVRITLPEASYVTLVIESAATGRRVRNLVSETRFPAGASTVWWDGLDDLGRDPEAARHGVYQIPGRPVPPGAYRVRGLRRRAIHLRYEFPVYNAGSPAWETADGTGGWLTNHTPPQAACFVPGGRAPGGKPLMYLGSYVSEGGSGLAWTDMAGRKVGGRGWIGGNWTAAPFLCRDDGSRRRAGDTLYVGAPWHAGEDNQKPGAAAELRVTAIGPSGDRAVLRWEFQPTLRPGDGGDNRWIVQMGGMAARDGRIVVSLTRRGELLFVDVADGRALGLAPLADPRGLAFDSRGRLLALTGRRLVRITLPEAGAPTTLRTETLVDGGLEDPVGLAVDGQDRVYVSDRGGSHQVKRFGPDGAPLGAIGRPGAPTAGPYDPQHMNNPAGIAVDGEGSVWVTEADYSPKRVSVWSPDGRLVRALYGPGQYGGGGTLDPKDPARFYYSGVEFRLNWRTGASEPVAVFHRPAPGDMPLPDGYGAGGAPETPIYARGRQYMTNCYTSNPTNGASVAMVWRMVGGATRPAAAMGRARDWGLLSSAPFRSRWPDGAAPGSDATVFAWSDLNDDGRAQADEVQMARARTGGVTVMGDLGFVLARMETQGAASAAPSSCAALFRPVRWTAGGAPVYALARPEILARGAQGPTSSGGDQALALPDGWTVMTVAPAPFAPQGVGGVRGGRVLWSYPSLWPGLHASHESPPPDQPGQLIGTTRLLGGPVQAAGGEGGALWCLNGNMGNMYLFTSDGLFVSTLFRDGRQGRPWSMPAAARDMLLDDLTLHDENFWPSISRTSDGRIYLVDGGRTCLVRVDGLETIRRIPPTTLAVTPADLRRVEAWRVAAEASRQRAEGSARLRVALLGRAPGIDGWPGADWATIDRRGVAAYFDSNSRPYDVRAALAVAEGKLHAIFRTGDPELLRNSGKTPAALFKTGGALDLMIGADAAASPARRAPARGDVRLLVTMVGGQVRALVYRPVVPGTPTNERIPFSSPWRTVSMDQVEDVSEDVTLEADGRGAYLLTVPLGVIRLKPAAGLSIRGDVGVLRGDGMQTVQRVYWRNKATGITADVPSEAELAPALWGVFEFR